MSTLTSFTSYDDIRAALGVSSEEIEDLTLSLPLYLNDLLAELTDVGAGLVTAFEGLPVDPDDYTTLQGTFARSVQLFATYAVAKHLTTALPLFSPKDITDGKASTSRYAQDPYKKTIEMVSANYETNRRRLLAAFSALSVTSAPAVSVREYLRVVSPASDPVLGT